MVKYDEETNERVKHYRNLKEVGLSWLIMPTAKPKFNRISKQGAEKLAEFTRDPNFGLYLKVAPGANEQMGKKLKGTAYEDRKSVREMCVLRPNMKPEEINTSCSYGIGISAFIDAFEEQLMAGEKTSKKKEWEKKTISNAVLKKYYEMLDTNIAQNSRIKQDLLDQNIAGLKDFVNDYLAFLKKYPFQPDSYSAEAKAYYARKQRLEPAREYWDFKANTYKEDIIKSVAEQNVEESVEAFVAKNVDKLANVLSARDDCDQIDLKLRPERGIVEGDFKFSCRGGDTFRVNNKLVINRSKYGTPFAQFPTTFHDIKHGQEVLAKESERWMSEVFSKKKR